VRRREPDYRQRQEPGLARCRKNQRQKRSPAPSDSNEAGSGVLEAGTLLIAGLNAKEYPGLDALKVGSIWKYGSTEAIPAYVLSVPVAMVLAAATA